MTDRRDPNAVDDALRRSFLPPAGLQARAALMVAEVAAMPPRRRRPWLPWCLAAAAIVAIVLASQASRAPGPVHRLAVDVLFADADMAFPANLAACTTMPPPPPPAGSCTDLPPPPYLPGPDEQLAGPLPCPGLQQAHRYWSRTADSTVLLLVLPGDDAGAIAWSEPGIATVERRVGGLRIVFSSRDGAPALEQRAARLR